MQLNWKKTLGLALSALMIIAHFASADDNRMSDDDPRDSGPIVLKNATLHTMGERGTFVGDLLISHGIIKAVGNDITVPDGAKVYDLKGCHVVPGLIESRGKLWLTPAAVTEGNTKAELNVVDAIDPWSEDWRELASQGITAVYVQPNSTSSLGGFGAVFRVTPHTANDNIVMKKEAAIQAAIGIRGATSKDRLTQFKALEKQLTDAKEKKPKADEDKKPKSTADGKAKEAEATPRRGQGRRRGRGNRGEQKKDDAADGKDAKAKPDSKKDEETNPTKIALRRVLKKEIPLYIEVHHSDVLKRVLGLSKKHDIRVVLGGLTQVGSCSEELKSSDIPMVVGPFMEQNATPGYRKNANLDWLGDDLDSSRLWSFSGFPATARGSRLLRFQAAAAIQLGIDSELALAAMTSNAARMLGVGKMVGSLEVGKQADIAVFAGDPLDPSTPTRLVLSNGQITFESAASAVVSSAADAVALPVELPSRYAVKTTRLLREGEFFEATLVVADGKIVSVGSDADVADMRVFDLKDTVVSPGLVVASSSLGQTAAINDAMESDASHLRSVDAVDPTKKQAKSMLDGGFVHVGLSPGVTNTSAGVIGHLRLGSSDYVANPEIANQFVLSKSARKIDRFPASLNGQIQMIDGLFEGHLPAYSVYVTSAIRRSIQHEKLANIQSVANGKRNVVIAADSDLEIRSAIAMAKRQGLSPALLSSGRVGDWAEKLAQQKFSLIVSPAADSAYDTFYQQIVTAHDAGVPLAFAGESPEKIRITAAMLVHSGVPEASVLKGMTGAGGSIVGMKNVGLEKGAAADFVVWSGSPLNLASKPLNVVVDGKIITPK